jgi:triosephosphate isomerase
MREKIVAGNWKMNTNWPEASELVKELISKSSSVNCSLVIFPPFTYLQKVSELTSNSSIKTGAQNCSEHEKGAYTGEVSASMLNSIGINYCIIGHSERREYFNESNEQLLLKVKNCIANNLTPVFCCGEKLEERENQQHLTIIQNQISEVLFKLEQVEFEKIIIAYEPVWAIGTGKTATAEQAQEIHFFIRSLIGKKYSNETANKTSILYGGSCKPSNAKELFAQPDIDGGLIGGASLIADDFIQIAESF